MYVFGRVFYIKYSVMSLRSKTSKLLCLELDVSDPLLQWIFRAFRSFSGSCESSSWQTYLYSSFNNATIPQAQRQPGCMSSHIHKDAWKIAKRLASWHISLPCGDRVFNVLVLEVGGWKQEAPQVAACDQVRLLDIGFWSYSDRKAAILQYMLGPAARRCEL